MENKMGKKRKMKNALELLQLDIQEALYTKRQINIEDLILWSSMANACRIKSEENNGN